MSQVGGLPLETEAASSPELGLQEGQVGGLQACAPVLPLNRSTTTYLTRRWCRTGRAVREQPVPHPQVAGSPIRHRLCPHPVHSASAPAAQPGLRWATGLGPQPRGQAHGWTKALRTQAHQKPRATRAEEQPHSRSSPHVLRDLGEPGESQQLGLCFLF